MFGPLCSSFCLYVVSFFKLSFEYILHLVVTYKRTPVPIHPITLKEPEVTVNNNNVSNVSTESRKRKKGKRETIFFTIDTIMPHIHLKNFIHIKHSFFIYTLFLCAWHDH